MNEKELLEIQDRIRNPLTIILMNLNDPKIVEGQCKRINDFIEELRGRYETKSNEKRR